MSQGVNAYVSWEMNSSHDLIDSKDTELDQIKRIDADRKEDGNSVGDQESVLKLIMEFVFDLVFPLNDDGSCYQVSYYRTPWGYKQHLMDELKSASILVCDEEDGTWLSLQS